MKRTLILIFVAILGVTVGVFVGENAKAQGRRGKDKKWRVTEIGEIPNEYGDLVAAVGEPLNWGLVFKNSDNEIYLVEFRGSQLGNSAKLIKRKYE